MAKLKIRTMHTTVLLSYCKMSANVFLMVLLLWPGWQCLTQPLQKQTVVMQIIFPFQSGSAPRYDSIHVLAKQTINKGREVSYNNLRRHFDVDSWMNFTNGATPTEILTLFCKQVFARNVNTILYLNYGGDSGAAVPSNSYIMKLAEHMGYPVISWDPTYPGALQSVKDSRVLQIAPTIYHQCQAMEKILSRYNWTDFSIVTSMISSHGDFISCMRDMVKRTSLQQGYVTRSKFNILTTVAIDIHDNDEEEYKHATIKAAMQKLIRSVTRVFLLHAESSLARDILGVAKEMHLTGLQYMWIFTSSTVGHITTYAGRDFPVGSLGIMYNDTEATIHQAMQTSIKLWAMGLDKLAKDTENLRKLKMYPVNSCNSSVQKYWKDGEALYRAMKSVVIDGGKVSFSERGVIENVQLKLYNVRPFGRTRRRVRKKWHLVGSIVPKKVNGRMEMAMEMDEIVWPGGAMMPPRGKPEKRFFKIVTLKELPYIIYVGPDPETGKCFKPAVPCKLNPPEKNGNRTLDQDGMIDYCCSGLSVDLLNILSQRMNFDYEMYEVRDREWGIQKDNGEWTGLIKDMLDNKADMVITSIKINKQRATAMDFSTPYLETGITIMVALRKGAISATAFLEPFDQASWILILLLCIPVAAVAIFTTEWFSPLGLNRGTPKVREPYDYPSWCLILVFSVHATGASIFIFEWMSPSGLNKGKTPLREHKFSLFRSFWLIWAMLFGASVSTDNPRGMSSRFLANVWALFALVFLASYTANLAAFMITIDEYFDLSGIQDWRLMNPTAVTPHFRFATIPGGSTEDNLKKNYPRMHKYMQKYNKSAVEEGIKALKSGEIHAFIYDATVLEYNVGKDNDCDLITVGKWYAMTGYGVGFPKGSPYIDEVNKIVLELQNNGELDRLQKFWLAGACHATKDKKDKSSHKIGILNFTSAFILLAGGVLLGTILLLLEHCYFKFGRKCLKKYDKCGCCSLVSLSMGQSLTFEQSVMDAIDYHKRHRCKDPYCETQLWKAKHELDIALIKIDRLKDELAAIDTDDTCVTTVHIVETPDDSSCTSLKELLPNSHHDAHNNVRKRPNNHLSNHTQKINNDTSNNGREFASLNPRNGNTANAHDIELSDVDKRRLQFRRSPSYTNAMSSTESDNREVAVRPPPNHTLLDKDFSLSGKLEASPKRCPSYSQAVEQSPVMDRNPPFGGSPKHNTRTRYHDGKYYVGVADNNDESAL